MKLLKDVFIKVMWGGRPDSAFIVDNLPWDMVYRMEYPRAINKEKGVFEPDTTAEKVETLLPGISLSQTGDGGLMFDAHNQESKLRLKTIDDYIRSVWDYKKPLPQRVPNAIQPSNSGSSPLPISMIPRVTLPVLVAAETEEALTPRQAAAAKARASLAQKRAEQ